MINKLLKYIYDYYFNRIECIFVALYLYKDFKCIKFGATRMELQKLLFTDLRLVCRQKKKTRTFCWRLYMQNYFSIHKNHQWIQEEDEEDQTDFPSISSSGYIWAFFFWRLILCVWGVEELLPRRTELRKYTNV